MPWETMVFIHQRTSFFALFLCLWCSWCCVCCRVYDAFVRPSFQIQVRSIFGKQFFHKIGKSDVQGFIFFRDYSLLEAPRFINSAHSLSIIPRIFMAMPLFLGVCLENSSLCIQPCTSNSFSLSLSLLSFSLSLSLSLSLFNFQSVRSDAEECAFSGTRCSYFQAAFFIITFLVRALNIAMCVQNHHTEAMTFFLLLWVFMQKSDLQTGVCICIMYHVCPAATCGCTPRMSLSWHCLINCDAWLLAYVQSYVARWSSCTHVLEAILRTKNLKIWPFKEFIKMASFFFFRPTTIKIKTR